MKHFVKITRARVAMKEKSKYNANYLFDKFREEGNGMLQHARCRRNTAAESSGILPLLVGLALVGGVTALVALGMEGAHDGRIAGNESMAIAAVWGVGGLGLAAAERRFPGLAMRHGARTLLAAGLTYLVVGALLGNARWAVPAMRALGYLGAIGATFAAELILVRREPDSDVNGLLSLTAAGVGYIACAFEVVRWLAPVFTLPLGQTLTAELYAWQESTRVFTTVAVWAVYGLVTMEAARRLRSPQGRVLAAALLCIALGYAAFAGLPNLTADLLLQAGSVMLLTAACLAAARLCRLAQGERQAREQVLTWCLTVGAVLFPVAWAALAIR